MVFHSATFVVFLIVAFAAFWALAGKRDARTALLLVASYVFYGAWEFWYLWLIVFSTLLDFTCGNRIHAAKSQGAKRAWLSVSLVGNLGVLGFFKYYDWGIEGLATLLSSLGLANNLHSLGILVPVGISFYTFQTLSYTLDIYRGQLKPARNLLDFGMFVAFFPQLVAGPIVRAAEFIPQMDLEPRLDRARFTDAIWRMGTGLVKKVVLADGLGAFLVDPVYEAPGSFGAWMHALALLGFTFQIYYDFSGYSDIAIGVGKLFGFDLPENFDGPFKSRSVSEFWRRWHMTLSFWVRDYVFFPLMGRTGIRSRVRIAFSVMTTMVVIGLWHGASLLWLLYGAVQGVVMAIEQVVTVARRRRRKASGGLALLQWALTFLFTVLVSSLCVRPRSFEQAWAMLSEFGSGGAVSIWGPVTLAVGVAIHFLPKATVEATRRGLTNLPLPLAGVLLGLVAGWVAYLVIGATPFIYFQF
ncbi:MBOAT family O-acyltransferase [Engelhardtia mirabilis]|uniref:MBOAT family O-acyltransferase n=1 Tax=Engelhardtia mirabilis TaxID=2528011 RepID=UPI0011A3C5AE